MHTRIKRLSDENESDLLTQWGRWGRFERPLSKGSGTVPKRAAKTVEFTKNDVKSQIHDKRLKTSKKDEK